MLKEYVIKLYEVYQSEGLVTATKVFGRTIGDYLLLEANIIKLRQIQENNNPFSPSFGDSYGSRRVAEVVTSLPFTEVSNDNLENIIISAKLNFLSNL